MHLLIKAFTKKKIIDYVQHLISEYTLNFKKLMQNQ